jgi:flavin-dependent dehydrogenase
MYDVIVVGAGPAGSTAARKCAEGGLKTLVLEKQVLPRDKVCSGMIMGPLAHTLIEQEFGNIPEDVLSRPRQLTGYCLRVPGIGSENLDNFTLLTWRRALDYWMSHKARDCGSEIWEKAEVVSIMQRNHGFAIIVERDKKREELETNYLIGADGATSVVRRFLFPELDVKYGQAYQEHYQGELDLDKNYFHWFYSVELCPAIFTVHQKDDLIVLDVTCRPGQTKPIMAWAREYLRRNHRLDVSLEPVHKGSCLEPALYRELTSHTFNPAKGNALLIGDAAGLLMPVSGEGIGLGMKSAVLAARSMIEAASKDQRPDEAYLSEMRGIISAFSEIYPWFRKIVDGAGSGGHSLPKILKDAYQSTLRML